MKRKKPPADAPKLVKTSISLPGVLMKFSKQQITDEGHHSFSAYVAHLLRLEKYRVANKKAEALAEMQSPQEPFPRGSLKKYLTKDRDAEQLAMLSPPSKQ